MVRHLGRTAEAKPYLPYQAAVEKGILSPSEELLNPLSNPPGVDIANGYMPNVHGAGLISVGNSLGAFDHATLDFNNNELVIAPSSKEDVTHDGQIAQEGAIILGTSEGRLKIAAFVIDLTKNPWIDTAGRRISRVGNLAVVSTSSFDYPEYEVHTIDADSGMLYARTRSFIR